MDLVRLYRVYQVHLPCLRSPFGAYPVDLVQVFKVDLVHPTFPPDFPSRLSYLTFLLGGFGKKKSSCQGQREVAAPLAG